MEETGGILYPDFSLANPSAWTSFPSLKNEGNALWDLLVPREDEDGRTTNALVQAGKSCAGSLGCCRAQGGDARVAL